LRFKKFFDIIFIRGGEKAVEEEKTKRGAGRLATSNSLK